VWTSYKNESTKVRKYFRQQSVAVRRRSHGRFPGFFLGLLLVRRHLDRRPSLRILLLQTLGRLAEHELRAADAPREDAAAVVRLFAFFFLFLFASTSSSLASLAAPHRRLPAEPEPASDALLVHDNLHEPQPRSPRPRAVAAALLLLLLLLLLLRVVLYERT